MSTKFIMLALFVIIFAGPVSADEVAKPTEKMMKMEMTTEQRANMASVHEKMAECLRSTTSVDECHKNMMKSCHDKMGKNGCPMMEHMGKMHGMMEGHEKSE